MKIPTSQGIVGFFDILGYQSFLDNNDPAVATNMVLTTFRSVGDRVQEYLVSEIPALESYRPIIESVKWLIFSDTVLITSSPLSGENVEDETRRWLYFILCCCVLQRDLFEFGLPLRGVIAVGDFQVHDTCFAGRPIVDCYRNAKQIELAATVFTKDAAIALDDLQQRLGKDHFGKHINELTMEYLVPLKKGAELRMVALNLFGYGSPGGKKPSADITQMVVESFSAHRKDISSEAIIKMRNTELFIRHLKAKYPADWN